MAAQNTQHNEHSRERVFAQIAGPACFAIGTLLAVSAAVLWLAASLEPQQHIHGAWLLVVAAAGSFGVGAHTMDIADRAEHERFEEETASDPPQGIER